MFIKLSKTVVALDVDDVIGDTNGFTRSVLESRGVQYIEPIDWHCSNYPDDMKQLAMETYASRGIFTTKCCHPMIPAAVNSVIKSKNKQVFFVTARQIFPDALEKTLAQL